MKQTFKIAAPVAITYFGILLMNLVDLLFARSFGAEAVGGIGVASSVFGWGMVFGLAIVLGLEFFISDALGKKDSAEAHAFWAQGITMAITVGLILGLILFIAGFFIPFIQPDGPVVQYAQTYLWVVAFSVIPIYLFNCSRIAMQARGHVRQALILLMAANIINACLCYLLGRWIGFSGLALATVIGRLWMAGMMAWVYLREVKLPVSLSLFRVSKTRWFTFLRMGLPAAFQTLFEVGLFSLAGVWAGWFSVAELAAHQFVIATASLTFIFNFGLGSAGATLVGVAYGAKDAFNIKRISRQIIWLTLASTGITASLFFLFPESWIRFFTSDPDQVFYGTQLFRIAGIFQLADGFQTVLTGLFRGVGSTRLPAAVHFVGHWVFGISAMYCFTKIWGFRVDGIWWSLCTSLTIVSITLGFFWVRKMKFLSRPDGFDLLKQEQGYLMSQVEVR